ncbi:MAG: A/G-specific adenine glycosylase [Rhodobacteraceae bacterium]|nr:A/G-specific adenine glycosylase [Paracoccaceae bacterium]
MWKNKNFNDSLLEWYDRQARALPWRVSPSSRREGVAPDPYRVWLSEVMLQQTTVATVHAYFDKFVTLWPTVDNLAAAPIDEVLTAWAGLGYYARARNLHKCAIAVSTEHGGRFPDTVEGLLALPGVGPYTAAAIAAIAFDHPAAVVDGNVERVMSRLFQIETPLPDSKPEIAAAAARLTPDTRPGDYAQAVMDLGATVCSPRNPACGVCPWLTPCQARRSGIAAQLPRKKPKPEKPTRQGRAYLALDGAGRVLLRRRPDKGLLGGMVGLPGGGWSADVPVELAPPFEAAWIDLDVEVRHTFTHFHLKLQIHGVLAGHAAPLTKEDLWTPRGEVMNTALPTLMKKALKLGLPALDHLITEQRRLG